MSKTFDAVVIGAGPGGYVAAIRLAQYKKKVAVIEKDTVGGVCLNVGCIPSKAMIHASELYQKLQHADEYGFTVKGVSLDMAKLQDWKSGVVKKLTGGIAQLLKANGVEIIKGTASFVSPTELSVKTASGTESVTFTNAVIATGSKPIQIPGFEWDGKVVGSSTDALSYTDLPGELCVIGGGYIGLEIASFYAGLGSKVTVVEAMESILPGFDPEVIRLVEKELKHRGVAIFTGAKAKGYKMAGKKAAVAIETSKGPQELSADKILVAVGRTPTAEGLNLEKLGVAMNGKFIKVNEKLQTNVKGIYAIGDVAGQPMLAHKASKEGLVAAAVIAGKNETYDVKAMPAVVFTTPEIATVGIDEKRAKEKGIAIKVGKFPFAASGKALATGATDGFVKMIVDAKTDLVLGVIIAGHDASSLIGEAALAIEMGAFAEDIARTVHPHPTLTETLMEAAEAVAGHAVHIFQRS